MADTATASAPSSASARRRFTWDEVLAMIRAGIIEEGGPEELLDGDLWVGGEPRPYTWDEVLAMLRAGILEEGGPEELLDGEIWTMASEGHGHSALKVWLNHKLVKWSPPEVTVACDTSIPFAPKHTPSPDFALFPSTLRVFEARGPDMLLVVEIADTSTKKDLEIKGPKYREYGVREYWVIDLIERVTYVHRLDGAWPETPPVPFDAELSPALAPGLRLRISESGI